MGFSGPRWEAARHMDSLKKRSLERVRGVIEEAYSSSFSFQEFTQGYSKGEAVQLFCHLMVFSQCGYVKMAQDEMEDVFAEDFFGEITVFR